MPIAVLRLWGFFTEPVLGADEIHRIEGEPERYAAVPSADTVTLVSWNIAYGRECEQHGDVVASLDADVCLLQEVDVGCRRSGFRNVAQWLADRLEMNWVFAGEFQEVGQGRPEVAARTGQAILSRYPISDPQTIVFAHQARLRWRASPLQPRRGARMALRAKTGGLRIYNAHLESGGNDASRDRQLRQMAQEAATAPHEPAVVGGDFNTGHAGHRSMLDVLQERGFLDAHSDHPAARRTSLGRPHAIDWILVRGVTVAGAGVCDRYSGSDHFPVWARVRRPAAG